MLEVTRETLLHLLRNLQARGAPDNVAMRLSPGSESLELFPDEERPGDRGFDVEDRTVLVLSKGLAETLSGQRLGIVEDRSGKAQLTLEPV
jgi:hypothetical protein